MLSYFFVLAFSVFLQNTQINVHLINVAEQTMRMGVEDGFKIQPLGVTMRQKCVKKVCFPNVFQCCHCVDGIDTGTTCFPSTSKVKLGNGKVVTMSELQLGDQVQTGNGFFI